jgi:uncharacterized protein YjbI with pentapeptide repeats
MFRAPWFFLPLLILGSAHAQEGDLADAALAAQLRLDGCPACEIVDRNLAGQNLDGANLAGSRIDRVDLRGASCRGCNLAGARIGVVQLDGADLSGANLAGVTLECSPYIVGMMCTEYSDEAASVNLAGATLTGADLSGLPDVILTGARADGARFGAEFPPTLAEAHFERVTLTGTYGAAAEPAAFTRAEIAQLAPFVRRCTGCWSVHKFQFFPPTSGSHHPPTFSCDQVSNIAERTLCDSEQLCGLDRMIAAAYSAARGAPGADAAAVKASQIAWLAERNACGQDAGCLIVSMRARVAVLVAGASPPAFEPGTYLRFGHAPALPPALSDLAPRLLPLLSNSADELEVTSKTGGAIHVRGESFGGNAHLCAVDDHYRFDPATGHYTPLEVDPDWDRGTLTLVGGHLLFEGGQALCGVRASLDGQWVRVDR